MRQHSNDRSKIRKPNGLHAESVNLYKFIRLVVGADISDRQIARKWGMAEKNFHEFKTGRYPVPRLSKIAELADAIGVNFHLVLEVATGAPAQKVFRLMQSNNLQGQMRLLSTQLDKSYKALAKSEQRHRELFHNINDAVLIADVKTGKLLDCNRQAEQLLGRTRQEIIGMNRSLLHPPHKTGHYQRHFAKHIRRRRVNDPGISEVIRKDGTIVPVRISARVFKLNGKKVIQGVFREVS